MDEINQYIKTNKKWAGLPVYKAYQFGEFNGYRTRSRAKQLRAVRTKDGLEHREVVVGWKYDVIPRGYIDDQGNTQFLTIEELEETFT